MTPTDAQITAAARALSNDNADVCNVNREDNWMIYGESFRESARVALEAAVASTNPIAWIEPCELEDIEAHGCKSVCICAERGEYLTVPLYTAPPPASTNRLTDAKLDAAILEWFSYERDQNDFRGRMRAAIIAATEAK